MDVNKNNSNLIKTIISIILFYTFGLILFIQFQMEFLGKVLIRDSILKTVILGVMIIYIFVKKKIYIYKMDLLSKIYFLTTIYILFNILFMAMYNNKSFGYIFDLLGVYFPIITTCFFININEKIDIKKIFKICIVFAIINLIVAFIQDYYGTILFKYRYDQSGNAIFNSINFITHDSRRVGITSSGYNLGLILVFLLIFSLSIVLNKKVKLFSRKNIFYFFVFLLTIKGILMTKTRNIYFFAAYSVIFFIIAYKTNKIKKLFMYITPVIVPIIYYKATYYISLKGSFSEQIYSSGSFINRLNSTQEAIKIIRQSPLVNILFGTGQRELYDNILLLWINDVGLVGLFMLIMCIVITYIKLINIQQLDLISIILATYLSAFFSIGLMNTFPIEYYLFSIILSSMWIRKRQYDLIVSNGG